MTDPGICILHLFSIINRRQYEELPTPQLPESTLITIHRCQVCNKEQQQQGTTTICLHCRNDEEIARVTQNNPLVSQSVYLRCHSIIQNLFFSSAHAYKKIIISCTNRIQ